MKKISIIFSILALTLLSASHSLAYFEAGGLKIYVRAEISKDNGATWYNFSADTNPGNQTLTVSPGDVILFRGKAWNEGTSSATNSTFAVSISNSQYLNLSSDFYIADEDGHGNLFSGDPSTGTVSLPMLSGNGSENDQSKYESGIFKAEVKKDVSIPNGTEIIGSFALSGGTEIVRRFIPVAYAQEGAYSFVKMVVSNPQAPLPGTGAPVWIVLPIVLVPLLWKGFANWKNQK